MILNPGSVLRSRIFNVFENSPEVEFKKAETLDMLNYLHWII